MSANESGVARALVSVADKTGVAAFAAALDRLGVAILSTGGTRRTLAAGGIDSVEISAVTGFPEIMDGRVKTLHPLVHGGILARRDVDAATMAEHGIRGIDLVAVNLYPFERTVAKPGCTLAEAIENIDIGGPALLRAAAKNHRDVVVVADPADYGEVARRLEAGGIDGAYRLGLAAKAFARTQAYDAAIASYFAARTAATSA